MGLELACEQKAVGDEAMVNDIVEALRCRDDTVVYGNAAKR